LNATLHVFPTIACNGGCDHCAIVPGSGEKRLGRWTSPSEWAALIRPLRLDALYITGGEPMLYEGVHELVNAARCDVWLYTNGTVDVRLFLSRVLSPEKLRVRLSFHPTVGEGPALRTVRALQDARVRVSMHVVDTGPEAVAYVDRFRKMGVSLLVDPDFRLAMRREWNGPVRCSIPNVVVGPDALVYPCTSKMVRGVGAVGPLGGSRVRVGEWYRCEEPGACCPCDAAFMRTMA
jgi:hypothetical protein